MNKKTKRIGIDARLYGPKGKGLGRYVQKLLQYLEKIDANNSEREYFIFLKRENFDLYQPIAKNFHKVEANYHWYSFAEQIFFLGKLLKYRLDLVHFCHFNFPIFYPGKFIVTIHDLILFHFPTIRASRLNRFFYWFKLLTYYVVIFLAGHRAEKVITVSAFTKQDLKNRLYLKDNKIEIIYEGAEFKHQQSIESADQVLKKYGIMEPYLLYVGNAYPHKNLECLIRVFSELKSTKKAHHFQLVLVGGDDYFYLRLKDFVKKIRAEGVVFCGFVPDQELEFLYKKAFRYVFPSLYEGFGLPPIEAMINGASVLSSNASCLPEILGDEGVDYFNPSDESEMLKVIEMALVKDNKVDDKIIQKIKKRFDWKEMAEKTLVEYKKIINE